MTGRRAWRARGRLWRILYSRTVLRVLAREWHTLRLYRTACRSYLNTSIDKNSRPGLGSRVSLSGLGGTHSIGLTITWICTHWCRPNTLKPCKSVRSARAAQTESLFWLVLLPHLVRGNRQPPTNPNGRANSIGSHALRSRADREARRAAGHRVARGARSAQGREQAGPRAGAPARLHHPNPVRRTVRLTLWH